MKTLIFLVILMNNHSPYFLDCFPEGQRGQRKSLSVTVKLPIIEAIKQDTSLGEEILV